MNFFKGIVSICHSFRSTGQPGRIHGLDRCFQVVDRCTARRHRAAVTPVLAKAQISKFNQPHLGKQKPFKGIIEPLLGIIEPLWGIKKPDEGINKLHLGDIRRSATASESKTSVIARTCSKAVVHTPICLTTSSLLNSYYLHKCFSKPSLDITNTYSSILSIIFGRTFREMKNIVVALPPSCTSCPKEFRGHPKIVKKVKRRRDRAPSRLPKKIIRSMKKRRVRWKLKSILRKYIPKSSRLYGLVTDYKLWYVTYLHKSECFFSNFLTRKKQITSSCHDHKIRKSTNGTKKYCVSRMKLLTSGDIELNPGPVGSQTALSIGSTMLLNLRLGQLGLRPVDVGGEGDCFFRAVSHQLYGDPSHHLHVRQAGVRYLSNFPERFIESNTEHSWNEYINNMSMQGTWCDALIVQAVADCQNLTIHIIESHENFAGETLIEPHFITQQPPTTIYLGHLDELHYVSTAVMTCGSDALQNQHSTYMRSTEQGVPQNNSPKRKRSAYMRKYRKSAKTAKSLPCQITTCEKNIEDQSKSSQEMDTSEAIQAKAKKIENLILKFHGIVSHGPLYICSCYQLWYKRSVSLAGKLINSNPAAKRYLHQRKSVNNQEWLCKTCRSYLVKNKVPSVALLNGMQFPVKPDFFDLNELECRLLAPRLAFQKLMQAPRGRQFKIHGNVVNVPAEVSDTVNMLPRLPSETGTIKVNLKRRLQYKSSALSLNVRPQKVVQAANWLIGNSSLYKQEGITLNQNWGTQCSDNSLIDDSNIEDQNQQLSKDVNKSGGTNIHTDTNCNEMFESEDEWSEDEAEIPAGVTDTMLTKTDFIEDNETRNILNVAPGEGNKPLSIFRDQHSEELAYPGIFLGQKRPENKDRLVKVHYSDICKSELRRSDRRAAMCVENIFFKAKKLQMKILLGKSQVALRKCKGNSRSLNAGQLKCEGAIERLIHLDEGFQFLRALRGSPPYFEKAKKDLFAMIRQLGPASLFCSFSSAETQWTHFLKILGQLVDDKEYSIAELENMNWDDKCRLIQSDPVTCARHFDYQISQFITNFLLNKAQPLGKISDWFYRVEYQQRGSPHIHMLIWLEGAPVFGVDDDVLVTNFIDNIISCQWPDNNTELQKLVNRQIHRHTHTCKKKSKNECRFNYPQPPMRATEILYPLEKDTSPCKMKQLKETWKTIKKQLNDLKEGEFMTFEELLLKLKVTESDYRLAVRSSLNSPTVFLKRQPNELRVNNYNPACLQAWRANMDIQFILDVYACAMYIVSYISKAQKGMSELLRQACAEARKGNSSIKQQVRDIGNKFLNSVEISAQEAVYIILQLPMKKSSREVLFINTAPPNERVQLLKPINDIKEMEDDCEDVYSTGLLQRYVNRTASLEHLTLADWAAWYDSCGKPYVRKSFINDLDNLPLETANDDENDDELCNENTITDKKNKKRSKSRVIRCVWFNKEKDPEKHYRELIMLFTPWRNEEKDLLGSCSSYQARFFLVKDIISKQMEQYVICSDALDKVQEQMIGLDENVEKYDSIAPFTQNVEYQDEAEGLQDLHPDFNENYDLSDDVGIPSTATNTEPLILNELQDQDYRQLVQTLNKKQKEFFYHILHLIKTSDKPFYYFLSGGAGVGKSHLVKSLYQAALKYYNSKAGEDFNEVKILLLAPTGKAAFGIKGNTIHSTFAIPVCQSLKNYKPLDSSRLNTLRCKLHAVKLIFLDEISMVGNTMFNIQINNRLKDIKGSREFFGGVSIIALGDLFQLEPVMDSYVFKNMKNAEYAALAPNIWQELFTMFELDEIMRQRDSKAFAEILNRLREGNHTPEDIAKLKQRCISENCPNYPLDIPHLFIQNSKVDEFNNKVHLAATGDKYNIRAIDSVIGANSAELRDKILKQIPLDPRKTKQLASNLQLAAGERTELVVNLRTDDGMTNGAGNIIKRIQLHDRNKPSGVIWVQFDHADVGEKTRHDNKHLYVNNIDRAWTPIKPTTVQFAVGRTQTAQVVRKQFPLRPAAAKTIHRSQGDTETKIVVNFNTRRTIPHIHYVGLSRVTTIEGLYITDLCENKIAVNSQVKDEMQHLRTHRHLKLSVTPIYNTDETAFKICFLNTRSLHRHIEDIRKDMNYTSVDVNIFSETRLSHLDKDSDYAITGYSLFRNDNCSTTINTRPYGGTAVYSKTPFAPGYPLCKNSHGIEITIIKVITYPNLTIIGVYRSPKVPVTQMCTALTQILNLYISEYSIFIGDFNVNWLNQKDITHLHNLFITQNNYRQLVSCYTTDNRTTIDHIYTNLPEPEVTFHILETYFSDHKAICASIQPKTLY